MCVWHRHRTEGSEVHQFLRFLQWQGIDLMRYTKIILASDLCLLLQWKVKTAKVCQSDLREKSFLTQHMAISEILSI